MALGTSGLGDAGLAREGVGLGSAGLEAGAVGGPVAPAADEYIEAEISAVANPGVSSGTRIDVTWSQDGLRVWDIILDGSPSNSRRQYAVSPAWGIDLGDWTLNFTSGIGSNTQRSIWWSPDGNFVSFCFNAFSTNIRITVYDQSATPWDWTVLGASTTKLWSPTGGASPGDHVWSDDGLRLWVQSGTIDQRIDEFQVNVAWDASSIVNAQVKSFNGVGSQSMGFSGDGTKLYFMVSRQLRSWALSVPFDVETASDLVLGPETTAARVNIPRGLTFRNDNTDIVVAGDQGSSRRLTFFRVPPP